jgi:outer membrane protein OmpA-like peptidoglycan-associated protein
MSDQPVIRRFRLFGEDAPGWLVWALALLGLAGCVATAHLLIPLVPKDTVRHYVGIFADGAIGQGQTHALQRVDANAVADRDPVPEPERHAGATTLAPEYRVLPDTARTESRAPLAPAAPVGPLPLVSTGSNQLPPQHTQLPSAARDEAPGPKAKAVAAPDLPEPVEATPGSDLNPDTQPGEGPGHTTPAVAPSAATTQPTSEKDSEVEAPSVTRPDSAADVDVDDCVPLFSVTFRSEGANPIAFDLTAKVRRLATWLLRRPATKVYIEGHADPAGDEDYNLVLSHRRAMAVADLLVRAGVPSAQLAVLAYGESMPVDPQPHSVRNRRVSMRVTDGKECRQTPDEQEG